MDTEDTRDFIFTACQIIVCDNKEENHKTAKQAIDDAVLNNKANIVSLPECWTCPYSTLTFHEYAEDLSNIPESSPSALLLSNLAKHHSIYLIGGSFPEKYNNKLYNTCLVFNPEGILIGKYQKIHLFDVDIPNGITFKESDSLSPGNNFTIIETKYCKIGIGICFDLRFPELCRYYQEQNCSLVIFPGAFNMTTGPAHWELLLRSRAVDYQMYICGISPARNYNSNYIAWGNSTIVNPWGKIIAKTEEKPNNLTTTIDLKIINEIRNQIPILTTRRILSSNHKIKD